MNKKQSLQICKLMTFGTTTVLLLPIAFFGLICYAAIDVFLLPVSSMALTFAVTYYLGLPIEYAYIPSVIVGYMVSFKPLKERLKTVSSK